MEVYFMNIKITKLRKFKFRTPEKFDLREETTARWKRLGLLDGLSGNINMNVVKLFDGALSNKF